MKNFFGYLVDALGTPSKQPLLSNEQRVRQDLAGLAVVNAAGEVISPQGLAVVSTPVIQVITAAELATAHTAGIEIIASPGATSGYQVVSSAGIVKRMTDFYNSNALAGLFYGTDDTGKGAASSFRTDAWDRVYMSSGAFEEYDSAPAEIIEIQNKPICFAAVADLGVQGSIKRSALNFGGINYAANDAFTVDGGTGTLATGIVLTQTGGAVTSYSLTLTPLGYLLGTGVATTSADGGTGLTINITELDYSENTTTVTVVLNLLKLAL